MNDALLFIGALGIFLGVVTALAISRGARLERLRDELGVERNADLEVGARRVIEGRRTSDWQAEQSRQELAYLIDLIGVGIVRLDDRLVVTMANQAANVFLGARPGGLLGRTAMEAFTDHRIEDVVERANLEGAATDELAVGTPGRSSIVVRARRSPTEGIWVVFEDVSELRRLQRIRAEFIDNLSHELRTPLTSVRLLTETLARDFEAVDVPPQVRDRVQKIDVETGHLVQMVNELLDLAKIEGGEGPQLYLDDVDLGSVVRGSVDRLRLFAERQGVTLGVVVPEGLPLVRGDDERLGQLLVNLLHNAIKFSPHGGDVVVRAAATGGGEVVVEVEDHGVGIPAADIGRVFERFYKVDRARVRGKGGTGLGLAIARNIAEGHGGRIWVESQEGHGSTFRVAIPAAPVSRRPAVTAAAPGLTGR